MVWQWNINQHHWSCREAKETTSGRFVVLWCEENELEEGNQFDRVLWPAQWGLKPRAWYKRKALCGISAGEETSFLFNRSHPLPMGHTPARKRRHGLGCQMLGSPLGSHWRLLRGQRPSPRQNPQRKSCIR